MASKRKNARAVSTRKAKRPKKTKAMALSKRDAVKTSPYPIAKGRPAASKRVAKDAPTAPMSLLPGQDHALIPAGSNIFFSLLVSQAQLFATLVKLPLTLMSRQQALLAELMFNARYPNKRPV